MANTSETTPVAAATAPVDHTERAQLALWSTIAFLVAKVALIVWVSP